MGSPFAHSRANQNDCLFWEERIFTVRFLKAVELALQWACATVKLIELLMNIFSN